MQITTGAGGGTTEPQWRPSATAAVTTRRCYCFKREVVGLVGLFDDYLSFSSFESDVLRRGGLITILYTT